MDDVHRLENRNRGPDNSRSRTSPEHKQHIAKVLKKSTDPICRMYKIANETISHILTACPKLAGSEYIAVATQFSCSSHS